MQPRVPASVRTQPKGHASGNDFESSAYGISIFLSGFDLFNHFLGDIGQHAAHDFVVSNGFKLLPRHDEVFWNLGLTYGRRVAEYLDTKRPEKHLRKSTGSHSRCGFAGAGPLKNVSSIRVVVL